MGRYVFRRVLEAIPALLGVTIISFVLLHIIPGNPARILLGNHYTAARAAILDRNLGLDHPLYYQYVMWLWKALHGNFQYSYVYNQPVIQLIMQALPHTLELVAVAFTVAEIFGVMLGTLQAYYAETWFDQAMTVILYFLYAMPTFWLGILLVKTFAIQLPWFPTGGYVNINYAHPGFINYLYHLVLPGATLCAVSLAGYSRYMRSSMRETLIQDYIRTARSKGAGEFRVIFVHAMRNSLLPLITLFGLTLPALFAGALVTEEIFNYPGMGLLFWNAATQEDMPVLLAIIVFLGAMTILGNLLADLLYAVVDPRISYD